MALGTTRYTINGLGIVRTGENTALAAAAATAAAGSATAAATSATAAAGERALAQTARTGAEAAAVAAAATVSASNIFATKAAANTGLAGVTANAFVSVLTDETRSNQNAIYQKVAGAYVFVRMIGDVSHVSETNNRPSEEMLPELLPSRREPLRELGRSSDRGYIESTLPVRVAQRINVSGYTESLGNAFYALDVGTKQTETVVVDGITLTRFTAANFGTLLKTSLAGFSIFPFVIGKRYFVSYYIMENGQDPYAFGPQAEEKFFYMKDMANGNNGFAKRYATNRMRRVWAMGQATSTSQLDMGNTPTNAYGAGYGDLIRWFQSGQQNANTRNLWIGGFQIEAIGDDTYVDGIAMIGDSTLDGSAGQVDLTTSQEISSFLEADLNCTVFNRAIGGNKLSDMVARWATDMTPLKNRCKNALIQGGPNDIATGRTLAQMQADVGTLVGYATTDGLRSVLVTCTPTSTIAANPVFEAQRLAFNTWLRETYRDVIDIARVIEDPVTISQIRYDPAWVGDTIHYTRAAKRAVAAFMAAWPNWEFRRPLPYQKIAGDASTWAAPAGIVYDSLGNKVLGQRGAAVADATDAASAITQLNAALARMRAHGLIA